MESSEPLLSVEKLRSELGDAIREIETIVQNLAPKQKAIVREFLKRTARVRRQRTSEDTEDFATLLQLAKELRESQHKIRTGTSILQRAKKVFEESGESGQNVCMTSLRDTTYLAMIHVMLLMIVGGFDNSKLHEGWSSLKRMEKRIRARESPPPEPATLTLKSPEQVVAQPPEPVPPEPVPPEPVPPEPVPPSIEPPEQVVAQPPEPVQLALQSLKQVLDQCSKDRERREQPSRERSPRELEYIENLRRGFEALHLERQLMHGYGSFDLNGRLKYPSDPYGGSGQW